MKVLLEFYVCQCHQLILEAETLKKPSQQPTEAAPLGPEKLS